MKYSKHNWSSIYPLLYQGISLNKISSKSNINKSTLYYHYRKIFGRRNRDITFGFSSDENIGEFIGVFVGDGCYSRSKYYHHNVSFFFSGDETQYVDSFSDFLLKNLDKRPQRYISPSGPNKIVLRYSSKRLIDFIWNYVSWGGDRKSRSVSLRGNVSSYSREFRIGFIRGLLDTDGYAGKYRQVTLSTASPYLNLQVKEILDGFRIEYLQYINTYANSKKMKITGGNWGPQYNLNICGDYAVGLIHLLRPRNQKRIRAWALPSK